MKRNIFYILLLATFSWCFGYSAILRAQTSSIATPESRGKSVTAVTEKTETGANSLKATGKQPCKVKTYIKNASCTGTNDGAVSLVHLNGTPPYKYEWNTGATTQNVSELTTGTYTVKVTDATGCTSSLTVNVPAEVAFTVKANVVSPTSDNIGDGKLDVEVAGGVAPYTYLLTDMSQLPQIKKNKQSSKSFVGLRKGRYIVDVVDSKGCISSVSLVIKSQGK